VRNVVPLFHFFQTLRNFLKSFLFCQNAAKFLQNSPAQRCAERWKRLRNECATLRSVIFSVAQRCAENVNRLRNGGATLRRHILARRTPAFGAETEAGVDFLMS
jgi:hypothetical protein